MTETLERRGTLATVLAAFFIGLNVLLLKIGTSFVQQLCFVALGLGIGGIIMILSLIATGKISMLSSGRKHLRGLLWISVVGTAIPLTMLAYAVNLSSLGNSFLLQVEAIYSMVLTYVLLKEHVSKTHILLTTVSFFGIALVLTEGIMKGVNVGDFLYLLAPLFLQLGHVTAKGILERINPFVVVSFRLIFAGLILAGISLALGINPLFEFSKTMGGSIAAVGLSFSYIIGGGLWFYGIKRINLSKATSIVMMYPLIVTLLAILVFAETLSLVRIAAAILVFFSTLGLSRVRSVFR